MVYYVDDDALDRLIFKKKIGLDDSRLVLFESVEDLIARLSDENYILPRVIVTNLNFENKGMQQGWNLLDWLNHNQVTFPKVFVLTNSIVNRDILQLENYHFKPVYISKPVIDKDLHYICAFLP